MHKFVTSLRTLAAGAAALLVTLPALAQQAPQNLQIVFDVSVPSAPLSDWLTAGIALLLAAMAMIAMRRQRSRGGRFFSAAIALAAGAALFSVAGERLVQEANALIPAPQINLITSPASIDVSPYLFSTPLTVTVNNQTGKFARITAINLGSGFYSFSTPTTCVVNGTMGPGTSCIITLVTNPG